MIKLTQNGSVADASSAMVSAQLVDADWSTFAGPHGKRRRDLSMNVRYVYKRLECGLYGGTVGSTPVQLSGIDL